MSTAEEDGFGTLLRRLRLGAGLTQEALAERAGVSAKAIGELERDPSRAPRLDTVSLLADALELDSVGRTRFLAAARPDPHLPAPIRSRSGVTGDLPRPLTPLFGRAEAVEAVAELARHGTDANGARLLVLTGPGGVGKTRLAIAAAARAAPAFADGAVFVDLAPLRDPALVLAAIAQRLDIDEHDQRPLPARLMAALRPKHLLLVLDNCEHLLPARDDLLALLDACPRLTILVTSREALRVRGEREYRVAPLDLPDAAARQDEVASAPVVALFLDRARAAGVDLDPVGVIPVVVEICRRLDGLPLAVELAAAWTRLLSPTSLLGRLDRRLPFLVGGPHDLPARQRTMRDTIAWSYDLLGERGQRLLRRLSVFAGGCASDAASSVCGETGDEPALLTELAALVDRSLLRAGPVDPNGGAETRLTMLETLREFCLERLAAHGETYEVCGRHAAYFLKTVEAAAGDRSAADGQTRIARDHDNVRVALTWLTAQGDAVGALCLTGSMWRFWSARGYLSEGRRWLSGALALPTQTEATTDLSAVRAKALVGAAYLALEQGFLDEAGGFGEDAVALARDLADRRLLVPALNVQGALACQRGAFDEAGRFHREALALAREFDDRVGIAEAFVGLASIATRSGHPDRGVALFRQALVEYRAAGDTRGAAETLTSLAFQARYAGDAEESRRLGEEAAGLLRAAGDTGRLAEALWLLGLTAYDRGDTEQAVVLAEESLALRLNRGDERSAAKSRMLLGQIALGRAEYTQAKNCLVEALDSLRVHDDRHGQALALALLGQVALAEGPPGEARHCFIASADLFQMTGNTLHVPWCLEGLAGLAVAENRWEWAGHLCGARDALRAALGCGLPPANPSGYARTLARTREMLGDGFALAYETGFARPLAETLAETGTEQAAPALVGS